MSSMRQIRTLAVGYPDGLRLPSHRHDWHQLVFAETGVVQVVADDRVWVVPPTRALWVPAGTPHALTMRGFVSLRTLYVPDTEGDAVRPGAVIAVGPLLHALIVRCVEIGIVDADADPAVGPLHALTRQELARAPTLPLELALPRDAAARRIAQRVLDDPADARSLAQLCRGSGASKRTLERRFVAETAMTFGIWRTAARLRAALPMLAAGRSVTDTALAVGYDSPSAFVAAFRRSMGVTPGAYARSATPSSSGRGRAP